MLKVVRVVQAPAVRCDDALTAPSVPAKIQSVEEVGAKKCLLARAFELAIAVRPVIATLKSSDYVVGASSSNQSLNSGSPGIKL